MNVMSMPNWNCDLRMDGREKPKRKTLRMQSTKDNNNKWWEILEKFNAIMTIKNEIRDIFFQKRKKNAKNCKLRCILRVCLKLIDLINHFFTFVVLVPLSFLSKKNNRKMIRHSSFFRNNWNILDSFTHFCLFQIKD